jgi:hypothetical protein
MGGAGRGGAARGGAGRGGAGRGGAGRGGWGRAAGAAAVLASQRAASAADCGQSPPDPSAPPPPPPRAYPPSFESVNFLEFVKLLAPFSGRVSADDKLNFLFTVYDVDGDGGCRGGQDCMGGNPMGGVGGCCVEPGKWAAMGAAAIPRGCGSEAAP